MFFLIYTNKHKFVLYLFWFKIQNNSYKSEQFFFCRSLCRSRYTGNYQGGRICILVAKPSYHTQNADMFRTNKFVPSAVKAFRLVTCSWKSLQYILVYGPQCRRIKRNWLRYTIFPRWSSGTTIDIGFIDILDEFGHRGWSFWLNNFQSLWYLSRRQECQSLSFLYVCTQ